MEVRRSFLPLLGCLVLLLGGCRSSQHVAMLEQELRLQEDRIYQLQDGLAEAQGALDQSAQENESLRRCLVERKQEGEEVGESEPQPDRAPRGRTQSRAPNHDIPKLPSKLNIEMPSQHQYQSEPPAILRGATPRPSPASPPQDDMLTVPPESGGPSAPTGIPPSPAPAEPGWRERQDAPQANDPAKSKNAARIETTGLIIERVAGGTPAAVTEGLSFLVLPRDPQGNSVAAPGAISVVLVDPAVSGPAGRVGRWDFDMPKIGSLYERSEVGEGFRLLLKLPEPRPVHQQLHLFVRYETADGRQLQAEMPFDMAQLALVDRRPVPATAAWQRRATPTPREAPGAASAWSARASLAGDTALSDAPAWNGLPAGVVPPTRQPLSVAERPQRPVWSPERK